MQLYDYDAERSSFISHRLCRALRKFLRRTAIDDGQNHRTVMKYRVSGGIDCANIRYGPR